MDPIGKVLVGLVLATAVAALLRRKQPDAEGEPMKPESR